MNKQVDSTQYGRLMEHIMPSDLGVMYPEYEPWPTDAELEVAMRYWPAWLFHNETNYPQEKQA